MKNIRHILLLVLLAVLFILPSCVFISPAKNETVTEPSATDAAVTDVTVANIPASAAAEDGYYTIDPNEVSAAVRFYDYDVNGTRVQILALRDDAGGVHVAFNTCQSCSPSPKAYYQQDGDKLVCQNCLFEFTADEVGIVHGGCNPWPVDGIEITEQTIRIPIASVEAMAPTFANWAGPKG